MPFPELPAVIASALTEQGYAEPTPVQAAVLEPEALGRDLIVSAQTGSGKTVAFGLAMACDLLAEENLMPVSGAPLALVIAPTRELALQVSRELTWLFAKAYARITTCVGGMDPSKERRALSHGTHIVVGTPGRLRDHLERGALDLSALRFVVLDEADEMLDMGFRDDLEEILDATPEGRRTFLFSATMPKPIVALAKRYQRDALRISTVGDDRGHGDIAYQAVAVSPADIEHAVINLLRFHEAETAMLFCATRDNVRHLHASLVERGFAAVALSGEHSQNERNYALQALRDKRARVCVATDVASRGIDVASLSLVIHVEMPRDAEILQHRSGRTGRAGKKGTAVLIVPYPRRKRVEMMLRGARIAAEWLEVPSAEAIREQDQERLVATLLEPIEASEEERALAARLLEHKSPEDLALALVRAHASRLPEPEDLIDISTRSNSNAGDGGRQAAPHHREGFDDTVWFRMDIGRRQNADPRWILPLLCRRGHITKNEIGAIRIAANETFFQVPRTVEAKFRAALARTAVPGGEDESGITIEPSPETPREAARENVRPNPRANPRPNPRPGQQAQHDGERGQWSEERPRHQPEPRPQPQAQPHVQPQAQPQPQYQPQPQNQPQPHQQSRPAPERRAMLAPRPAGEGRPAPDGKRPFKGRPTRDGKPPFKGPGGPKGPGGFKGKPAFKGKPPFKGKPTR
jgi:ATP-dependent RNA helicase DeaD